MNDTKSIDRRENCSVSVVIPIHNAGAYLERCLKALAEACEDSVEIILVDDASTDEAIEQHVGDLDVRVLRLERQYGAAYARNWGVRHSAGEIVFFTDADVALHPDAIRIAVETLLADDSLAAVFGSYDDEPGAPGFLSQYRNLMHYWVHQNGAENAETFWTGCGAVRRTVFVEHGGFDPYDTAIEDIKFGRKLRSSGCRIRLRKDMLGKHLKIWSLYNILRTDLWHRAVPWVAMIDEEGQVFNDLNVNASARIATAVAGLLWLSLAGLVVVGRWPDIVPFLVCILMCVLGGLLDAYRGKTGIRQRWRAWIAWGLTIIGTLLALAVVSDYAALIPLALSALVVLSQWPFFRFLLAVRGAGHFLAAIPMQLLYFTICGLSVPLALVQSRVAYFRPKRDPYQFPHKPETLFDSDAGPLADQNTTHGM